MFYYKRSTAGVYENSCLLISIKNKSVMIQKLTRNFLKTSSSYVRNLKQLVFNLCFLIPLLMGRRCMIVRILFKK